MHVLKFGFLLALAGLFAVPSVAQDVAAPPVVFQSGTGDASLAPPVYVKPPRAEISCETLGLSSKAIENGYYAGEPGAAAPRLRLDRKIFETAVEKYRAYYCAYGRRAGPAVVVVVDFAKSSSVPRLYRVDLRDGDGLDSPIVVAHGIGSDPDQDGFATIFSNVQDSLTSSLGAAIGGERYVGANGISLRLDGLEPSNNQMRARDIVVHSYQADRRRYFNAELIAVRGRPGSSEGCFVVEPDKRDWILDTLENGGFIYSGYSGELPKPFVPVPGQNVVFAQGTGANPQPVPAVPALEIPAGTSGTPPTSPISPTPAAQPQ